MADDEVFRALAEPRRRAILRLVAEDEHLAGDIADRFDDVSRTTVSQHLTVLRDAGLLDERREGTRRWYRARPEGLDALRTLLEDTWGTALQLGKRQAEGGTRRRKAAG